ncbi:MAG: hypothetical protein ACTHO8_05140 [Solirubrobacterales bacterium]
MKRVVLASILGSAVALCCAPAAQALTISGFDVSITEAGGALAHQAGSHPYEMTTELELGLQEGGSEPGGPYTEGDLRDLQIEEPAGLIENPAALPQCTIPQFNTPRVSPFEASLSGESCPDKTQIGVATLHTSRGGGETRSFGVYNLVPPPGAPSRLGFSPYGVPIAFTPHIRQGEGEYGIDLTARNFPQSVDFYGLRLTIWGTPWAIGHDTERGNCLNESDPEDPWAKCSVGRPRVNPAAAYLTLPPSCSAPPAFVAIADSWQESGAHLPDGEPDLSDPAWKRVSASPPKALEGCDKLSFNPEVRGRLTTERAASPTGFDLGFEVRDEGVTNPALTAPSPLRKAVVTLADGMTLNPSMAAGLGVCTPAEFAAETATSPPGAGCPNDSKIGDFTVDSPLFAEPVAGGVFLAQPFANPFDALVSLYTVAKAPERGIIVKLPGRVDVNPVSGRLTATFDHLPQLPYSSFDVRFREGQRSPLLSPQACGAYATSVALSPWLNPEASVAQSPGFQISAGIEGAPCPSGTAPFAPIASGGNLNAAAGAYTPFHLRLERRDTEQEITSYSATLPPGLLGKIAGIPYCPDADIEAAARETGAEEEAHPSCPAASEIGRTYAGFGVGAVLAYAPGRLYLAGPFHGSSFSVVAIDAATVGPFDLGTIVVRSAIEVDPHNAQVSIDSSASDPIPHIIDGIPIHLRDLRVYLDRPQFMLNPTSCDPLTLSSTLTGSAAPFTDPKDISATVAVPFQAASCSSLAYRPRFSLHLSTGRHGRYPSLRASFVPRAGDANTARATVTLPPSEFLAQAHIQAVCARSLLQVEACPGASVYGRARAVTPLLAEPMEGPLYLASSSSGLPNLVAVLHGEGIRILLEGRIDSSHRGIRATFTGLPDAPVSRFTLTMFGGSRGLLVNGTTADGGSLCRKPQYASARFLGQDNSGEALRTELQAPCPKRSKGKSHHHGGRH